MVGSEGRPAQNNRLFVEAVLYRYRVGVPWRDLPERFGTSAWCIRGLRDGPRGVCGSGFLNTWPRRHRDPCRGRCAWNPLRLHLTAGQKCELDGADVLLPGLKATHGARGQGLRRGGQKCSNRSNGLASRPSRARRLQPRTYDREVYKARHLIENFFANLKQFRTIATRYDKTKQNFLAAIHFAAVCIWLV